MQSCASDFLMLKGRINLTAPSRLRFVDRHCLHSLLILFFTFILLPCELYCPACHDEKLNN